jgi:hypothetical protein
MSETTTTDGDVKSEEAVGKKPTKPVFEVTIHFIPQHNINQKLIGACSSFLLPLPSNR